MMLLSLEDLAKKSTSYSFHDCVESNRGLVFLSVPAHTDASRQYWSHFRLKRRIGSRQALLCVLAIAFVPLLFAHWLGELFFSGPLQVLDGPTHGGNTDLDSRLHFPGLTMLSQCGVRSPLQLRLQLGFQWGPFAWGTPRNRLGQYMTLFTSLSNIPLDRGF